MKLLPPARVAETLVAYSALLPPASVSAIAFEVPVPCCRGLPLWLSAIPMALVPGVPYVTVALLVALGLLINRFRCSGWLVFIVGRLDRPLASFVLQQLPHPDTGHLAENAATLA